MDRDSLVYNAKLAEQIERYEEMVAYMKSVVEKGDPLGVEERDLLSVSYKNVVGTRRNAWRQCHGPEQSSKASEKSEIAQQYLSQLELEITTACTQILQLVDTYLLKDAGTKDSQIFYLKMKGDYYRYMAEIATDAKRTEYADKSDEAYKSATSIANKNLAPTHPIRLGLALNYSVFYYEIVSKPEIACQLAKSAFDDAIAELDQLSEDGYKNSTLIMQLLRDNLTLWTSDIEGEDDAKRPTEEKA